MANGSTVLFGVLAAIVAVIGGYIALFGIPPTLKRWAEEQALDKMGENKASYMTKGMVDKLPEADNDEIKFIRKDVKDIGGGLLQNDLGKQAGNTADNLTKPLTGR